MKICIDDGSTNIKLAWTENGERRNAISPNSFKSEWSAPFGGSQPANYMLDGVRYGFDPVSDRFVQTTDTQYQYSDVNVIAIHHALVKSGITPQEVDVVVTLPLSEYFDTNAQPDMANINRKKANVMRPVEYQNGEAFTIRNVRVMPESIPAGFKALADMSPFESLLIVDLGGTTLDVAKVQGQLAGISQVFCDPHVGVSLMADARVNVEHYLSPCPSSEFSAMGDVTALSTEDITEGPLAGRTALYAEIEPTERMKQLVADGKKIYSSIELHPQFSVNGRAYLVGLAMTDTPASLGTERLKFTAQQRQAVMTFNSVQGEAPLISEAIESEIIEMAEQRQEEGTQWFNRVMGIIGRGRKADDASFSRIQEAVEGVATSQADIIDRFNALETRHQQDSQKITSLTTELAALKEKLRTQDGDPQNRFTATGAASDQLADF